MNAPDDRRPLPSDLISGELSDEQFEALLERAERDPELSAELDLAADIIGASEPEMLAGAGAQGRGPREDGESKWSGFWLKMAAIFGLCFWVAEVSIEIVRQQEVVVLAELDAAHVARLREPPVYLPSDQRGPEPELRVEFERAMAPYVNGDWRLAIERLSEFTAAHPENYAARFYLGAARDQVGLFDDARKDFEWVALHAVGLLGERAEWRAALACYSGTDGNQRAVTRLRVIERKGGALSEEARALLWGE